MVNGTALLEFDHVFNTQRTWNTWPSCEHCTKTNPFNPELYCLRYACSKRGLSLVHRILHDMSATRSPFTGALCTAWTARSTSFIRGVVGSKWIRTGWCVPYSVDSRKSFNLVQFLLFLGKCRLNRFCFCCFARTFVLQIKFPLERSCSGILVPSPFVWAIQNRLIRKTGSLTPDYYYQRPSVSITVAHIFKLSPLAHNVFARTQYSNTINATGEGAPSTVEAILLWLIVASSKCNLTSCQAMPLPTMSVSLTTAVRVFFCVVVLSCTACVCVSCLLCGCSACVLYVFSSRRHPLIAHLVSVATVHIR